MADGGCFGGMVACGETYLPAFALAVGLSETAAALAASLPVLCGGLMQMISLYAVERVGGPKRWIVLCATIQALSFVPLVIAAMVGSLSLVALLLIASVYWGAGMSTGPAWNTWMEDIVPTRLRKEYFPRRTRLQLLATLGVLLASGLFLQLAQTSGHVMLAFTILFALAAVLRLISAGLLASHQTPRRSTPQKETYPLGPSRKSASPARLILFLVFVQAAVQLSGPFFAPYMLKQLEFSYGQYIFLISVAFIAKVAALRGLGEMAKEFGSMKLLIVGSLGLVPLSSLWLVSTNFYWLCLIQLIAGVVWAAYELGFFLMFFEAMPVQDRTRLLSYYNFGNSAALVVGATIGATILSVFGCSPTTYYWLFGLSSLGRLACLPILFYFSAGLSAKLAPGERPPSYRISLRALSLRPSAGSISVPILASLRRSKRAKSR
jgi:MFS family permease